VDVISDCQIILKKASLIYFGMLCTKRGSRRTTKSLSCESRFPSRNLDFGFLEYEAGILITQHRHSIEFGIEGTFW